MKPTKYRVLEKEDDEVFYPQYLKPASKFLWFTIPERWCNFIRSDEDVYFIKLEEAKEFILREQKRGQTKVVWQSDLDEIVEKELIGEDE